MGFTIIAYAQTGRVGINTVTPQTTFDLNGQKDSGGVLLVSDITGLQAPRVSRQELTAKGNSLYGTNQRGAIIYINDVSTGDVLSQRANINTIGYYYFDGTLWQKFVDTKSLVSPSGFERKPDLSASTFYWRLIGAATANYGTEGKYGLDATWNPSDLTEIFNGTTTYNDLLTANTMTVADLGAKGKNSFTSGTMNSASGDGSASVGAGNISSGYATFTSGQSSSATGIGSTAMGVNSKATGIATVAIGTNNTASGIASLSLGLANTVSGDYSTSVGVNNSVVGGKSFVTGEQNTITSTGGLASALGNNNIISALRSHIVGNSNNISSVQSIALGNNLIIQSMNSTALGFFNTLENTPQSNATTDVTKRLLVLGNGLAGRSDAMTILRNGKTGIGINNFETTTSDAKLQINGTVKIATLSTTSTCNSANEGSFQYLKTAGIGVFQGCVQTSATPTYAWVNLN